MNELIFSPLDIQFARFLAGRSGLKGEPKDRFELLIKRLSASLADGHSCLELTSKEEQFLSGIDPGLISQDITTPLVLWRCRLYLQRYYRYELRLAKQLRAMARIACPLPDRSCTVHGARDTGPSLACDRSCAVHGARDTGPSLACDRSCAVHGTRDTGPSLACDYRTALDDCFGHEQEGQEPNFQRRAAEMALQRPLALISGGPGTGKTSTVARILGLLLLTLGSDIHIALAAPTGKAAMRLSESIANALATLPFTETIKERIPSSASTLHRLLGVRHHSPHFRHTHANPLPWDVVVVDEASMVDLAMMSKLVDALKPGARLILLGDRDQLASVESGAVLADCIEALPDNTVTLQKSYRFNQEIRDFARAVNTNDSGTAWAMLTDKTHETATVSLLHEPAVDFAGSRYRRYMQKALALQDGSEEEIRQLFQCFNQFRLLCATRRGDRGVETLNHQLEQRLAAEGSPIHGSHDTRPSLAGGRSSAIPGSRDTRPSLAGAWYPGRPVMILANDYSLRLFNGDIGICLPDMAAPDSDAGSFKVWFEHEDGSLKGYQPYRLPACETVFAMTIHKSQGSEFDEVLVVLPKADTPLLTRELIYTAVTRAKTKALIDSDQAIFRGAVNRTISRASGLHAMLTDAV